MTAATVAVGPTSLLALHRALHVGRRFGQFISAGSRAPRAYTRFQIRHSRVAVICRADVRRAFLDFFLDVDVSRSVSGAVRPGRGRESIASPSALPGVERRAGGPCGWARRHARARRSIVPSYVCRIDKTRRVSRPPASPSGGRSALTCTAHHRVLQLPLMRAQRDASTTRAASRPGAPPRAHARTPGGRTAGARLHARRSACARSDQFTSAAAQSSTTCRPRQTQPRRMPPRAATSAADRRKSARSRAPGA